MTHQTEFALALYRAGLRFHFRSRLVEVGHQWRREGGGSWTHFGLSGCINEANVYPTKIGAGDHGTLGLLS